MLWKMKRWPNVVYDYLSFLNEEDIVVGVFVLFDVLDGFQISLEARLEEVTAEIESKKAEIEELQAAPSPPTSQVLI